MSLDDEWSNETGPLANNTRLRGIYTAALSDTMSHTIDLAAQFDNAREGYYVVQADGDDVWISLSPFDQAVDRAATGSAAGVAMLVPSGTTTEKFRISSGPHPTVVGTICAYTKLNYQASVGTNMIRVIRKGHPSGRTAGEVYQVP